MTDLLTVESVSSGYDRRTVVEKVSVSLAPGELVALIGHNGGGKSTLLKTIVGLLPLRGGRITFDGADVSRLPASRRVDSGLCLVPQLGNTFPDLCVQENLALSAHMCYRTAGDRDAAIADVYDVFPVLKERTRQAAGQLSGGQRQMLALGIALLKQPKVLLLDEPSLGLSPALSQRLLDNIVRISTERGTAVLIVEQNVRDVLGVAKRAYVMQSGQIVLAEPSDVILDRTDLFALL
ncbi:MAG TPA: ABC transporter ATP-binding protein [Pseudonocardiaceae bacterium]|jgi:branched-chain amino acid transport system ATP-binding protein|nr:ABC transporter ATP-binding protein [Pseudonocardiaceae bacterium]